MLGVEVNQVFKAGKNAFNALFDGLPVGFDDEFRVLRLLVRVIYAGKAFDLALVNQFIKTLDVALAADFNGALDIDFDKIADVIACPLASLAIRRDGGRNADHVITCQQTTDKGDTLNVGIAVLAAKTKTLTQVCAYDITIQHLNFLSTGLETMLDSFGKGAFAST